MSVENEFGRQYLSFVIENEEYCVDIDDVQEIRRWEQAKPIPNTPSFIVGIVSLRGLIIPIVDLRARFGVTKNSYSAVTVVVYIQLKNNDGEQIVGVVVDEVVDVYEVPDRNLKSPPEMFGFVGAEYLKAIVLVGDKMVAVIDLNKIFDQSEIQKILAK
jgi:purine-binding chemotaxis protein CheW